MNHRANLSAFLFPVMNESDAVDFVNDRTPEEMLDEISRERKTIEMAFMAKAASALVQKKDPRAKEYVRWVVENDGYALLHADWFQGFSDPTLHGMYLDEYTNELSRIEGDVGVDMTHLVQALEGVMKSTNASILQMKAMLDV